MSTILDNLTNSLKSEEVLNSISQFKKYSNRFYSYFLKETLIIVPFSSSLSTLISESSSE